MSFILPQDIYIIQDIDKKERETDRRGILINKCEDIMALFVH
jgi:hypothetical protein